MVQGLRVQLRQLGEDEGVLEVDEQDEEELDEEEPLKELGKELVEEPVEDGQLEQEKLEVNDFSFAQMVAVELFFRSPPRQSNR